MTFLRWDTAQLAGTIEGTDPRTGLDICVQGEAIETELLNHFAATCQALGKELADLTPDEIAAMDAAASPFFHTEYWVDKVS